MGNLKDKIINIAKENGWSVYIEEETENYISFDFGKYSPAGQDFHVLAVLENMNIKTLVDTLKRRYENFDCSEETYLWLDSTGHGKNGAPYDMKDVYEDMESCQEMIMALFKAFEDVKNIMTVRDLNRNQLGELKQAYAIQLSETPEEEIMDFEKISDEVIFNHYDGVTFTDDDFFCSYGNGGW